MERDMARLVQAVRPSLSACPVCPAKGACVFVTPGYDPGYCLHEYRLLHAYLARRLRAHPTAGASHYPALARDAARFLDRARRDRAFDPASPGTLARVGVQEAQATLDRFVRAAT